MDGRCGRFSGTGEWRFQRLSIQSQQIPGVALPPIGVLIDPHGHLFFLEAAGETELHQRCLGACFSQADADFLLTTDSARVLIPKEQPERIRAEIAASGLPLTAPPEFNQALLDYGRPMWGRVPAIVGINAIAIFVRGTPLSFGVHPMAPFAFSMMEALALPFRLRNDGKIAVIDEQRLKKTLIADTGLTAKMPMATPPDIAATNAATLDIAVRFGLLQRGLMATTP